MLGWILDQPLVAAALVCALIGLLIGTVTIVLSAVRARQDQRRTQRRNRVREGLVDRLFEPEPDWEQWVAELSGAERRELRWVIDAYLRRFRGSEREKLCALAEALDLPTRARGGLRSRSRRFRSLTLLAALGEPVEDSLLRQHCTATREDRAAAARVLHESGVENADRLGTELLLAETSEPLSAFGLDTLYQLNHGSGTPLLSLAVERADQWGVRLRIQVLIVLTLCQANEPAGRFRWVLPLLDHDSPRMRTAATQVMGTHGWRGGLREEFAIDEQFTDPHLPVRQATYHALAAWGDDESASRLDEALFTESTQRGLLAVCRALRAHPGVQRLPANQFIEPYTEWVTAETHTGRYHRRTSGETLWA